MSSGVDGRLYVVATPIGNLEDITLRALRILGEVDVVAAEDTRSAGHLLSRHAVVAKELTSFFEGNEAQRADQLVERMRQGAKVAVISEAGMPGVSDPGQRLVSRAVAAGIPVTVIPGASAAVTAVVGSGLPTDAFAFLGFPPRDAGPRQELFGRLRTLPFTLVFYESPGRTAATLKDLAAAFGGDRPAVVCRELTKMFEESVRGTLSSLAEKYATTDPRGEVTLVVGPAGPETTTIVDVESEIKRRLATGETAKEIAAAVAVMTGKPRRQIYQLALALSGKKPPKND